jgi:hypothetical protein
MGVLFFSKLSAELVGDVVFLSAFSKVHKRNRTIPGTTIRRSVLILKVCNVQQASKKYFHKTSAQGWCVMEGPCAAGAYAARTEAAQPRPAL